MSKLVINWCLKNCFPLFLNKTVKYELNSSYCQRLRMMSTTGQDFTTAENNSKEDSEIEKLLKDEKYEELVVKNWRTTTQQKDVLLVMPRQKWGDKQMDRNYAKHLMNETIGLINTLPNMKVIDSLMISTLNINSRYLFGSGNFQLLRNRVKSNPRINGIVFSLDMLNSLQTGEMEKQLGVDVSSDQLSNVLITFVFNNFLFNFQVYDRYSIVLNIFRMQSTTKEAKLQIALAEIPYIRNNLRALQRTGQSRQSITYRETGGFGQTDIETRKMLLNEREIKLKKLLDKIQSNRDILRLNRQRKQFPVIAVVGYTNSGKTSLIKALTDDQRLVPRNQLFATLDVTVHEGRLPSGIKVLYTDTIGFISHIPTALIQSFRTTLREICSSDLIVHVLDVSHPNHQLQEQTVNKTLEEIQVPEKLKNSVLEVANKIDLVTNMESLPEDKLFISATRGSGLNQLLAKIEELIIANTGRLEKVLRYVF